MSVLSSNRKESGMEFLKNARDIEEIMLDIRINKPKRYSFFYDKLLDYAMDILNEVKAGNSIYPEIKDDIVLRLRHFKEGIANCQVLVSQIEILRHKLKDDGISIGQVEQLAEMLDAEIRLIKGVMEVDKKRYQSLPKEYLQKKK